MYGRAGDVSGVAEVSTHAESYSPDLFSRSVDTSLPNLDIDCWVFQGGMQLTSDRLRAIHDDLIVRYGGEPGVRDEGTVEHISWLSGRMAEVGDAIGAAAVLVHCIAVWHPFNDGNKRTAIVAAATLLEMHGQMLKVHPEEGVTTMLRASRGDMSRTAIKKWLRDHITDARVP